MLRVPFGELQDQGVVVSQESIEPYHDWKLLLVNSVHVPGITHKGALSGIEYVNEAAMHPIFAPHLERLMEGYARIVEADIPIVGKRARRILHWSSLTAFAALKMTMLELTSSKL